MLAAEDLDNLVGVADAAREVGVSTDCVHQWVKRGYLKPSGLDDRGRKLYRLIDVLRVARDTRRRAVGTARIA